jgi:hypothetical protein
MRGSDKGHLLLVMVFLVFNLVVIFASTKHTADARAVPLLAGGFTLILILVVLINEIHPLSAIERINVDITKNYRPEDLMAHSEPEVTQKKLFTAILGIAVFFLTILALGFYVSIPLFTFIFMRVKGRASWTKAFFTAAAVDGLIFVFFKVAMGVGLFKGLVFGEILPPL